MNVRYRRLTADYERIQQMLQSTPHIRIAEKIGNPPERYELEYGIKSLVKDPRSGKIREEKLFRVEMTLGDAYPRMAPQCRMVNPVFHPNIVTDAICVTDYWSAGSSLARLLVRIGELLAYQSYSLKFPLNPEAAVWVEKNQGRVPTDTTDFVAILHSGEGVRRNDETEIRDTDTCVECGKPAGEVPVHITESNHLVCEDCLVQCTHCHAIMSNRSPRETCETCGEWTCYKCIHRCLNCGILVCTNHMIKCDICELGHCASCVVQCADCGATVCVEHAAPAERDGETIHRCETCLLQES